jgi:hypothetical protein
MDAQERAKMDKEKADKLLHQALSSQRKATVFFAVACFFFSPLATLQLSSWILTSRFVPSIPRPTGDIFRCHTTERSEEKRQMEVAHVGD